MTCNCCGKNIHELDNVSRTIAPMCWECKAEQMKADKVKKEVVS